MEVNDSPVSEGEGADDDANPMPSQDLPDLSQATADIRDPTKQSASLY